ncbi:MAG: TetR family transcriptional regulator C-terminal domain-containing protein [Caulobacteraceae bacterium]|nr:TetR family transcriptional regulator C-terminal domain-containing protein [Caulobacteraceae bacterium]
MTRGRIKGDHEVRRAEIARAACAVILRNGLAATSLAEIAREMGYTTGVLRHYFLSKEELLFHAKNSLFDAAIDARRDGAQDLQGRDKLTSVVTAMIAVNPAAVDRYRLLAAFNGSAIGDEALMSKQHARNQENIEALSALIAELQACGLALKGLDPRMAALGLLALIDGLWEHIIMKPQDWGGDDLAALVMAHVRTTIFGELPPEAETDRRTGAPSAIPRET